MKTKTLKRSKNRSLKFKKITFYLEYEKEMVNNHSMRLIFWKLWR